MRRREKAAVFVAGPRPPPWHAACSECQRRSASDASKGRYTSDGAWTFLLGKVRSPERPCRAPGLARAWSPDRRGVLTRRERHRRGDDQEPGERARARVAGFVHGPELQGRRRLRDRALPLCVRGRHGATHEAEVRSADRGVREEQLLQSRSAASVCELQTSAHPTVQGGQVLRPVPLEIVLRQACERFEAGTRRPPPTARGSCRPAARASAPGCLSGAAGGAPRRAYGRR